MATRTCKGCGLVVRSVLKGKGRFHYCSEECMERTCRERTRAERFAAGPGIAPESASAWGESVEDFLAAQRPSWAREPSPVPDAWSRRGDVMDSAAGAP